MKKHLDDIYLYWDKVSSDINLLKQCINTYLKAVHNNEKNEVKLCNELDIYYQPKTNSIINF